MPAYVRSRIAELPNKFAELERSSRIDVSPSLLKLEACQIGIDTLEALRTELARSAREEDGASWSEVGRAVGRSKQAVQERFGKRRPRR